MEHPILSFQDSVTEKVIGKDYDTREIQIPKDLPFPRQRWRWEW
jgi:hypothetical protein